LILKFFQQTTMHNNQLDVIIVNWNSGTLLHNCITSILNSNIDFQYKIIIVDNDSKDDSLNIIPPDDRISMIRNNTNKGFGAACNQGVLSSKSEFVLFLNPDTEVGNDTLNSSLTFMQDSPSITVFSCKQVDRNGNTHRTCARYITLANYLNKLTNLNSLSAKVFPTYHMSEWDHNDSKEVEHVMGSYYLIRRKDFVDLGLFDEDYFVYYEDLDLSYRVNKSGGVIYHETGGTSKNIKAKRLFYSMDSLLTYGRKHFSKVDLVFLYFVVFLVEPFVRIAFNFIKLNFKGCIETVRGYKMLCAKYFFFKKINLERIDCVYLKKNENTFLN
jgi:N-acetylglucosaminyl-diphospho-decaprenol L-rhamnosyltransferase